eukprot:TRINITY_DN15601_c0_g1_i1.p1 TRINITY_DN15601_c0_g1~~TRINITY_DN15601_c0_g1_i1.p1  ORF type:complete len:358 (+),score=62.04 TRINITY_DN15601_c0_g1_i1:109-1182(+)
MSSNGGDASGRLAKKESRKPKYSRFTQQELPACKPLLTPTWVITIFAVVGVVFVPIGGVALYASRNVVEVSQAYESVCIQGATTNAQRDVIIRNTTLSKDCRIELTVTKRMKAPVYIYYQLDNFYQNHRRYVKSRVDSQLRRDEGDKAVTSLSACKPQEYLRDNVSLPIDPCGLIAWSFFNDTYIFRKSGSASNISVDETGIAWDSDRKEKFGDHLPSNFNTDEGTRGGGTLDASKPLNENEHLIVWMRTAALPTFRKLWGKIHDSIEEGENITVYIKNNYNTYSFNGKKKIVLSTASWLGGKNDFLGIAYLTVGCLCLFLSLIFFIVHLNNPRPLGDTSYLSWHRKSMAASSMAAQ